MNKRMDAVVVVAIALVAVTAVACEGTHERVAVLRAKRIELIDKDETLRLDVGQKLDALEERIKQLELTCSKPPSTPAR